MKRRRMRKKVNKRYTCTCVGACVKYEWVVKNPGKIGEMPFIYHSLLPIHDLIYIISKYMKKTTSIQAAQCKVVLIYNSIPEKQSINNPIAN